MMRDERWEGSVNEEGREVVFGEFACEGILSGL